MTDNDENLSTEEQTEGQQQAERRDSDRRATVVDRRNGAERRTEKSGKTESEEKRTGTDRREMAERRSGPGRRATDLPDMYERRGPGIRRSEERRAAEEGEMTDEQWLFLQAIEEYKRVNSKPFPTWTEVLEVIKKLGYRKVDQP